MLDQFDKLMGSVGKTVSQSLFAFIGETEDSTEASANTASSLSSCNGEPAMASDTTKSPSDVAGEPEVDWEATRDDHAPLVRAETRTYARRHGWCGGCFGMFAAKEATQVAPRLEGARPPRAGAIGQSSMSLAVTASPASNGVALVEGAVSAEPRVATACVPSVDAIHALDNAGRSLEALRLLEALGDDSSVPDAGRIREEAAAAQKALLLVKRARGAAANPRESWVECSKPDVHLWYRYDWYTGTVEVVGDVTLESNAIDLWAVLREFHLMPKWTFAQESTLLQSFSKESELYYVQSKALLPVLYPTEIYTLKTYIDSLDEHGVMIVLGNSPPLDATEYRGFPLPAVPPGLNRVSAESHNFLRPVTDSSCVFTMYRRAATPFPYLPSWIVGMAAGVLVDGQMAKIRGVFDNWPGSEFEDAVCKGTRSNYYASLRQRIKDTLGLDMPDIKTPDPAL
mmetsp:Transcript_88016/g.247368  ORF Transcript_88016/g.247368 Transcript_88016/m.247368 type:complete len:456 (+) Transcript_88016:121-1488(+)